MSGRDIRPARAPMRKSEPPFGMYPPHTSPLAKAWRKTRDFPPSSALAVQAKGREVSFDSSGSDVSSDFWKHLETVMELRGRQGKLVEYVDGK